MKFAHYNQCWQEYKSQILAPEMEELKAKGGSSALAERICHEWSVLPPEVRGKLVKKAAEGYAHDGIDQHAAEVIRMGFVEGLESVKAASDCQGAEDELARMWKFLALRPPQCTLEEAPSPSTPFALAQDAIERLQAGKAVDMAQIQGRILESVPQGKARKVLEKRWQDAATVAEYPAKYADTGRRGLASSATAQERAALEWPVSELLPKCLLEVARGAAQGADAPAALAARWRAAVSSLEGLLDLYEHASSQKWYALQERLRQAAVKLYQLAPAQQARLGMCSSDGGITEEKSSCQN